MFEPEPTPTPPEMPPALPVVALAVAVALFISVGGLAQVLSLGWGLWFSEAFVFLGASWVVVRLAGLNPVRFTGFDGFSTRGVLFGFGLGAVNYFAWAVPLMWAAQRLFPKQLVEQFDGAAVFKDRPPLELAFIVSGVCLAAPVCEEFFFRGVIQGALARLLPPPRAIVVAALLFSGMHFDPVGFTARFQLGVLFGLLLWRSGTIWPGIGAHAANNLVSSLLYFAAGVEAEDELIWWVPLAMLVVGNVVLGAMALLARRRPAILAGPPTASLEGAPLRSLGKLAAPWLGAALVAIGVLLAVDFRGVLLNAFDLMNPVGPKQGASESLKALRARARAGETPVENYFERRRAAAQASSKPPP